jgi:ribonucleoside-triphosphate reductase
MQAPTLLVVKEGIATRYVNASNIKQYIDAESTYVML